ncbi:MAG: hypothetical protein LIO92_12730, partial [Clostridiales bacterium]|nr:hypothetical protein [Clostridiales bacterium]
LSSDFSIIPASVLVQKRLIPFSHIVFIYDQIKINIANPANIHYNNSRTNNVFTLNYIQEGRLDIHGH